jgi:glucose-1-phosphate thymidylyltransferase
MSSQHLKDELKGLVLAGGKGTRLRPLTHTMAKQLVPVANRPILWYALDSLVQAGIKDIGIIISPETGEAIEESVNLWQQPLIKAGVTTTFILQEEPLGLAHAVKIAKPYLKESPFAMYLGDNLIQNPLNTLVKAFLKNTCDAQILLKPVDNPQSFGVATLDENNNIIELQEKPLEPASNLALVGVYMFKPSIFDAILRITPSARGELEITDAIQDLIKTGKTVHSHVVEGWWLDTGKKDDLLEANRKVLNDYCKLDVQGKLDTKTRLIGEVQIGRGCHITNCVIQGPVRIGDDCTIKDTTIGPNTSIGKAAKIINATIENSVILENCVIQNIVHPIEQSLMGQGCVLTKAEDAKHSYHLMLGDHSALELI